MHIADFIGELQHYKNVKLSYPSTYKWAISPILSDQVTLMHGWLVQGWAAWHPTLEVAQHQLVKQVVVDLINFY